MAAGQPQLVTGPFPRPKTLTTEACQRLPGAIRESRNRVGPGPQFLKNDAALQKEMAETYRYISRADLAVGRIMPAVTDNGLSDNTVVVFTSDNGSMHGAHRLVGK